MTKNFWEKILVKKMFRLKNRRKKILGPRFFKNPKIFYINFKGGGGQI